MRIQALIIVFLISALAWMLVFHAGVHLYRAADDAGLLPLWKSDDYRELLLPVPR